MIHGEIPENPARSELKVEYSEHSWDNELYENGKSYDDGSESELVKVTTTYGARLSQTREVESAYFHVNNGGLYITLIEHRHLKVDSPKASVPLNLSEADFSEDDPERNEEFLRKRAQECGGGCDEFGKRYVLRQTRSNMGMYKISIEMDLTHQNVLGYLADLMGRYQKDQYQSRHHSDQIPDVSVYQGYLVEEKRVDETVTGEGFTAIYANRRVNPGVFRVKEKEVKEEMFS